MHGQQPRPQRRSSCGVPIPPLSATSRLPHAALHQPAVHCHGRFLCRRRAAAAAAAPTDRARARRRRDSVRARARARAPTQPASQQPSPRPARCSSQSPTPRRLPQPYRTGQDGTGREGQGERQLCSLLLPTAQHSCFAAVVLLFAVVGELQDRESSASHLQEKPITCLNRGTPFLRDPLCFWASLLAFSSQFLSLILLCDFEHSLRFLWQYFAFPTSPLSLWLWRGDSI